ncbi:RNA-guided endonuclease TnpB family protein [Nocardiopsis mangrovi]|uniref:RNA-guided endonuclease TnpB family protein n=1 Tax=Nocardiopsis mangrovi TaxID=1179818 RepID=A0ABV9E2Z9_9ACTN
MQQAVYHDTKAAFDLAAQPAVRVIKKVVDAYATLKANIKAGDLGPEGAKRRTKAQATPIAFREDAAQPYDDRILTWNLDARTVRRVNRHRRRMLALRTRLQKKRTKSARRALKRVRRRESRYAAQRNHIVSKKLVATAERTSRGIGLEDLSGIRQRVTAEKNRRSRLHAWAFAQLGAFIQYKARRSGVPVVVVDPRNTSRRCCECRHIHRTNRVSQAMFACRSCGVVLHADINGSRDIAHRADAAWQRGAVDRPSTA